MIIKIETQQGQESVMVDWNDADSVEKLVRTIFLNGGVGEIMANIFKAHIGLGKDPTDAFHCVSEIFLEKING
jgi:hypothetical protein